MWVFFLAGPTVLEAVRFLNQCLVPRTKFIRSSRELAWRNFYANYVTNMPYVITATGSPQAATWLCQRLFETLLHENYPLSSPTERQEKDQECEDLGVEGRDIVSYIGGHILSKLKQRLAKFTKNDTNEAISTCLDDFLTTKEKAQNQLFTSTMDRGRLVYLKPQAEKFFLLLEIKMRNVCSARNLNGCKLSDFEEMCAADETITSAFHSFTAEASTTTKEVVFSKVTLFFFKIRVHHECKTFKEKLNSMSRVSKQTKGLRKKLKEGSSMSSD